MAERNDANHEENRGFFDEEAGPEIAPAREEAGPEITPAREDKSSEIARVREEAGSEIAPTRPEIISDDDGTRAEDHEDDDAEGLREWNGLGWAGLILSILSLLFLPIILGTAGMIMGYLAFRRGAPGLGLWAMGIGAVSIIGSLFFAPFF